MMVESKVAYLAVQMVDVWVVSWVATMAVVWDLNLVVLKVDS
jgi:hypothetical protein